MTYGLCIDTCHLFAAGYDLSNESGVSTLIDNIDSHHWSRKYKNNSFKRFKRRLGI